MKKNRLVMIPGPTPVIDPIRVEMGREIMAFGDPDFIADYKELLSNLNEIMNGKGEVFALAGTGTLAMEMAIANSVKSGDHILIVSHGFFGDRFIDICERKGIEVDIIRSEWGEIVPVEDIKKKLLEKQYAAITVSHVDTSTGARAPLKEIGELLKSFPETLYIVDGVAATGGEFTDIESMGIDVLFTASQKAFGVCPGMFVLWASERAIKRRESLGTIPEYFVDYKKWLPVMNDPAKYFATPPINLIWAMLKSTRLMREEGMRERFTRHEKNARAMQNAFTALGFKVLADENYRAVTLSNLVYPDGLDDLKFRVTLMKEGIMVAAGLGPYAGRMCRIGHMGNVSCEELLSTLAALERSLRECGVHVAHGTGITAYLKAME